MSLFLCIILASHPFNFYQAPAQGPQEEQTAQEEEEEEDEGFIVVDDSDPEITDN